jgi:hypothetical protein
MKHVKLILLLVLFPTYFFGQSLSGLWMGNLTNDSTSVRQDQSFEIVLSQYKEKVVGYSRSTFIVRDTLYYIVKRVRGTINGDICEVKDDHVVSHNFPKKPEKGVKVISTFRRNKQDSTWYLEGDWKTTQTKKYYTVTGKVDLKEEKDVTASKLFPHLEELGLEKDVPVFASLKKKTEPASSVTVVQPDDVAKKNAPASRPLTEPAKNAKSISHKDIARNSRPQTDNTKAVETKKSAEPVTNPKIEQAVAKQVPPNDNVQKISGSAPTNENKNAASEITDAVAGAGVEKKQEQAPVKTAAIQTKPEATAVQPTVLEDLGNTVIVKNNSSTITTTPTGTSTKLPPADTKNIPEKKTAPTPPLARTDKADIVPGAAVLVTARVTEPPQYVSYVSDSLVLILYDNGEVDGDTVSVLLNGEMFWAKQGLKTSAIKKTIYITPGNEELTLVLYAENLGKYPPNTGLLVVYDGEDRHQLRFSADLQKNASVVFRRKK